MMLSSKLTNMVTSKAVRRSVSVNINKMMSLNNNITTQVVGGGLGSSCRLLSSDSSNSTFDKVGVIGLGLMGHGICQVAAQSGKHSQIVAFEQEEKFLDVGRTRIEKSIEKLVAKEKLTQEQATTTLNNITWTTDIKQLENMDFIVEAVIENLKLKQDLYTQLGNICQSSTIFASNTSSLSISEMAQFSGRQENFVGIHFFNPVQIMKLVEVIKTNETSDETFNKAYKWVEDINKIPVTCGDTPGFIVNRLLVPFLTQSMLMIDRNDATIDRKSVV